MHYTHVYKDAYLPTYLYLACASALLHLACAPLYTSALLSLLSLLSLSSLSSLSSLLSLLSLLQHWVQLTCGL